MKLSSGRMVGWLIVACGLNVSAALAQSVKDYAVPLRVNWQTNPLAVSVSWPFDAQATNYTVYRKSRDASTWGNPVAEYDGTAVGHQDNTIPQGGLTYEYCVIKYAIGYYGVGFVYTGYQVPLQESRGKILLLVDNSHVAALTLELAQFEQSLVGDGWTVVRQDFPRMTVNPANNSTNAWATRSNELAGIKGFIKAQYQSDPANVRAVFILGHLPIPYSGNYTPDSHGNHQGAWPTDLYYGDMDGNWTDASVTSLYSNDPRNWNYPGDGKFDQNSLPSDVELQVGRVDFANLPTFAASEQELLRQYLRKNHNFRQGIFQVQNAALINDNLGLFGGEVPAACAWRNFDSLVGRTNIVESGDWFGTLASNTCIWGYGCGPGTFTSVGGVATTLDFSIHDPGVVFNMFFGSYFGDWDSADNLMRSSLATPTYTLTCTWGARPNWVNHHMGLGENIGFSTRVTQNQGAIYSVNSNFRKPHIALLGDPTLRMHVVTPPSGLKVSTNLLGGVNLNWIGSPDNVEGYHVYRAPAAVGPFVRLNSQPLTITNYSDLLVGTNVYMLRAVKLEVTASGSYYNASQGIFQDLAGSFGPPMLRIVRVENGAALSWSANSVGYRLESTTSLLSNNWLRVPNTVLCSNGINSVVVVGLSGSSQLFRLSQP